MAIKKIIFVLLLLPLMSMAGDLETIRERVLQQIGVDVDGSAQLPAATIDTLIQRGMVQVCRDFPAFVQSTVIELDYEDMTYSMPSDFLEVGWDTLMWCVYFSNSDDTTTYPLPHLPPGAVHAAIIGRDQASEHNRQTSHIWVFGGTMYVWPPPIVDNDSVLVGYRAKDSALTDSGAGSSLDLKEAYWEDLIHWVCFKALERVGRYSEAAVFGAEYEKARGVQ